MISLGEPLLRVAARDRRHVTDFDYRVLTLAVPHLSEVEERELKADAIAADLGVDRSNVNRALRNLCRAGFLIRVDRDPVTRLWRYRLPRSPAR